MRTLARVLRNASSAGHGPLVGLLLAGTLATAGCGGSKASGSAGVATGSTIGAAMGSNIDRSRCDPSGKRVTTGDTNQDNKPDVWKYYTVAQAGGQDVQVQTCKQVDLNHDGKIDMADHFDATGALVATEYDFDFDGRFDKTVYFMQGKKVRAEQDLGYDGRPDHIEYYEAEKLARVEIDGNSDGKVDQWQYYENGRLDRIGYDTTGSGKVDKWERAPEEAAPAEGAAPPPAPAGGTQPPAATAPPPAAATQPPAAQ